MALVQTLSGSTLDFMASPTHFNADHAQVTAGPVLITPEVAERLLTANVHNRALAVHSVGRYAQDMASGNWEFTGDPIRVAADGSLLDGQHRLAAVMKSGRSIVMMVVSGLTSSSQDLMDSGRKRTAGDMFRLAKKANPTLLASTTKLVLAYKQGRIVTAGSGGTFASAASKAEQRKLASSDPLVSWAVSIAATSAKTVPARPAARAFSLWLMATVDKAEAEEFILSLAEMRTNGSGDPRLAVLTQLANRKTADSSAVKEAFLLVSAWNAWRRGEQLGHFKVMSSGRPRPFPKPI